MINMRISLVNLWQSRKTEDFLYYKLLGNKHYTCMLELIYVPYSYTNGNTKFNLKLGLIKSNKRLIS